MKRILRNIALALVTGYVFFFFGERVFWSLPGPGDTLISNLLGWLLYSFAAYATLIVVDYFKVKTRWSAFLAAAFFGWLIEGVVAMTFFGAEGLPFPITVSWTGLAWHGLIGVFLGWYLMLGVLSKNQYKKITLASITLGIFWGVWSLAWALETPPISVTPDIYLLHGLLTTLLLCASYYLFFRLKPAEFRSSRWERIIIALPVVAFFGFVTIPFIGLLSLVLPVFFGGLYLALRKNKKDESESSFLASFSESPKMRIYPLLLIAPIIAALIYNAGPTLRTNLVILIITTALGFILLSISLYKVFRRLS